MTPSPRSRMLLTAGIVFTLVPFALGLVRFTTANDSRLLWMALAGFIGGAVATALEPSSHRDTLMLVSIKSFLAATVLAAIAAYLLGARAAAGVWGMAAVLGFLFMCGDTFIKVSRAPHSQSRA